MKKMFLILGCLLVASVAFAIDPGPPIEDVCAPWVSVHCHGGSMNNGYAFTAAWGGCCGEAETHISAWIWDGGWEHMWQMYNQPWPEWGEEVIFNLPSEPAVYGYEGMCVCVAVECECGRIASDEETVWF